jgi:hypothetical protein
MAPEIGSGVWKATLGYAPGAMMSNGKTIWKIGDPQMAGTSFGSEGNGQTNLAKPANATVTYFDMTVPYWDGIEALFGNLRGTTYLRFRDGTNPSSMNVRAAPDEAVVLLNGVHDVIVRDLKIVGGRYGVKLTGNAQNNTIEQCYIANGQRRIWVNGAQQTTIRNNILTLDGIGFQTIAGGSWYTATHRHQYGVNKIVIGTTDTDDASIMVMSGGGTTTDTYIVGNEISHGQLGMQISQTTSNTQVTNNYFHHFSDTALYVYPDNASIYVSGNLFNNEAHALRFNNVHRNVQLYLYANYSYQPQGGGGKHFHISPDTSQTTNALIWIYHNSFAGEGYAADVGYGGTTPTLPNMHVRNNFISSRGLTSGPSPNGWDVASNYFDTIWRNATTVPDFVLPAGHPARNTAPSLLPFGLPGMTTTYYQDNLPDMGAIQGTSQSTMPPPTRLRATTK